MIILPEKPRRYHDPWIAPAFGKRGPCALCKNTEDLTENHVPPESVGNFDRWHAKSWMTSVTANRDLILGRSFRNGLKFRTLCASCNNGLGGREDKAIGHFFDSVRKIIESPIAIQSTIRIAAKPNQLYKGLLAHMISANDNGIPTSFDIEGREVFSGRKTVGQSSWNLFYWIYDGPDIFLMRNARVFLWHPTVRLIPLCVLKIYPLGFVFTQEPWFFGLPNVRWYTRAKDDDEFDLPVPFHRVDRSPIWPVQTGDQNAIIAASDTYGMVATKA